MSEAPELSPGERIAGRYVLVAPIGEGGFGSVWRARDETLGKDVALKALHPGLVLSPKARGRFAREAEILGKIRNPHVVRVDGLVEDAGRLYIAMELLGGRPLHALLGERRRQGAQLSLEEVVELLDQICMGLAAAHEIDVIHRDLKPANVHLASEDPPHVKLLDFGIAKMLGGELGEDTTRGAVMGSYSYMAPEQIASGPTDRRTDVFTLATLAFELLTLERAWVPGVIKKREGSDVQASLELYSRITSGSRPRPSTLRAGLSPEVDKVFAKAWAAEPAQRYPDVWALRDALVGALGLDTPRPVPRTMELTPPLAHEAPTLLDGAPVTLRLPAREPAPPDPRRARVLIGALAALAAALAAWLIRHRVF